jgi:catechol 2,3-dioxygenase-like lactoylglutathione lyase family enzyme
VSRIQLALNVEDVDEAVTFYSTLFAAEPVKRRPGYASFAVQDPPVKLVLFESPGRSGTLNHLGIERGSSQEVADQADRLEAAGLTLDVEGDVVCCYARQDKHWVVGPDGQRWENYVVLADAGAEASGSAAGTCCT